MLTKVYDLKGVEFEKETVDAKECVAVMGWTTTPQEIKEPVRQKRLSRQEEAKKEQATSD